MKPFDDAYRQFIVYSARNAVHPPLMAIITGLDAFANMPNAQTGADVNNVALIDIDVEENGGFVNIAVHDVITDVTLGVSYAVTRVDSAHGNVILTVALATPATTAPSVPGPL